MQTNIKIEDSIVWHIRDNLKISKELTFLSERKNALVFCIRSICMFGCTLNYLVVSKILVEECENSREVRFLPKRE